MSEQNSGGSTPVVVSTMNMDGTVADSGTTKEENASTKLEPAIQDGAKEKQSDFAETAKAEETQKTDEQIKIVKDYKAHKMTIDLLEEKFNNLKDGRIEDSELREWFDEHPEFADMANRSKRIKNDFRSLMEREPARKYDPDLDAKRKAQTKDEEEIDDNNKSLPLTEERLKKILEERDNKILEKSLVQVKESEIEEYAVSRDIKDDSYEKLKKTAEAIYKANPDMEFKDAIKVAGQGLFPTKNNSSVNIDSATPQTAKEEQKEKIDLTQWTPIEKMK